MIRIRIDEHEFMIININIIIMHSINRLNYNGATNEHMIDEADRCGSLL